MKLIITGVGHSEKSKSAAAPSTKPASTQSFSATVMQTTDNGEKKAHLPGLTCICGTNDPCYGFSGTQIRVTWTSETTCL